MRSEAEDSQLGTLDQVCGKALCPSSAYSDCICRGLCCNFCVVLWLTNFVVYIFEFFLIVTLPRLSEGHFPGKKNHPVTTPLGLVTLESHVKYPSKNFGRLWCTPSTNPPRAGVGAKPVSHF